MSVTAYGLARTGAIFATLLVTSCKHSGDQLASGGSAVNAANAGASLTIDQTINGVRPELIEWWWNNLELQPDKPAAANWQVKPRQQANLGAEAGAIWKTEATLAGQRTPIEIRFTNKKSTPFPLTMEYGMGAKVVIQNGPPQDLLIQYQADGDATKIKQQLTLPPGLSGDKAAALRAFLADQLQKLPNYLPPLFRSQFLEKFLYSHGSSNVSISGINYEVVVNQKIYGVKAAMVDWWWDNIGNTERYRHWHPMDHVTFAWLTAPKNPRDLTYDVGAVQRISERIGDSISNLDIEWANPKDVPQPLTYNHFVYGFTRLAGTPFGGYLLHEYRDVADGIEMKSTFVVPLLIGREFVFDLAHHCQQEMQMFSYFLPRFFAAEYKGGK